MLKQWMNKVLRKGLLVVVGLAVAASVIVAAAPLSLAGKGAAESLDLQGVKWVLVSIDDEQAPAGVEITALFDGEKVAGLAGCNNYFAGYEGDDAALTISAMGMTMMMCSEPEMQSEMAFSSALASAKSYSISGETLEIAYEGGRLVFAAN